MCSTLNIVSPLALIGRSYGRRISTLNKKRGFFAKGDQIRLGIDFLCFKNAILITKSLMEGGGLDFVT